MALYISMIVRNEADRHLEKTLRCARDVLDLVPGLLVVTDDCSDDATVEMCLAHGAAVHQNLRPTFCLSESAARQANYDFVSGFARNGDWILALDGDETISSPHDLVQVMEYSPYPVIGLPLLEFWEPTQYRVDGFWVGTHATRLYKWEPFGVFQDQEMGGGSEPLYVKEHVQDGQWLRQDQVELHHWGYLRPEERPLKRAFYEAKLNNGHNNDHVASITSKPTLRNYPGDLRY